MEPRGVVQAPRARIPSTRGVHWIVKMMRPAPGATQETAGVLVTLITLVIVLMSPSGAVVHVTQLGLEAVEPLPVVHGDSDDEAEHEDGDDHAHGSPGPAPLPRQHRVWAEGGGRVIQPDRHRAVSTWRHQMLTRGSE